METRIYHGNIAPNDLAAALIAHFNRGNYRVQQVGNPERLVVQIATAEYSRSGGQTAITVTVQSVEDGVSVQIGEQAWLGVAASLGMSALSILQNPWNILGRLDDIAQDIESLQIEQQVWQVVDQIARVLGTGQELSERLQRMVCDYCNTANPVGTSNCIACGAPLGAVQPTTCRWCGFVVNRTEKVCPNCHKPLYL
jgi:RNA polymerase subunit RPABC4/transcription elongation factor Spt4